MTSQAGIPTKFLVPKRLILKVVLHACRDLPREACGLLVLENEVLEPVACKNDATDDNSFEMCVEDLLRWHESGLPILGTYHSHPRGKAEPSQGDIELLEPNKLHLIVGMRGGLHIQLWQFLGPRQTPILVDMEITANPPDVG